MATIRQFEVFLAIADAGSMRQAADRLGISQPTISKQIKALERSVGGTLMRRSRGGRATLAPLGLELLDEARSSVEMHRRFAHRSGDCAPPRIYLRNYLLDIVKNKLDRLESAGLPGDTTFIVSDDPLPTMVGSGSPANSFAIAGQISLLASKDLISQVLIERTCSVYVSPALAARLADGSLTADGVTHLYPSKDFKLTPWLRAMMRQSGYASRHEVYGRQFVELIAEQVANGEGMSVFMDFHVQNMVENGRLVALARCPDPLLQVLIASSAVDSALFTRIARAFHAL